MLGSDSKTHLKSRFWRYFEKAQNRAMLSFVIYWPLAFCPLWRLDADATPPHTPPPSLILAALVFCMGPSSILLRRVAFRFTPAPALAPALAPACAWALVSAGRDFWTSSCNAAGAGSWAWVGESVYPEALALPCSIEYSVSRPPRLVSIKRVSDPSLTSPRGQY